jgi:hypothetical protein
MGLVWILDSDVYTVAQTQQQAVYTSPGRLLNQKIGLNFTPQEVRGSSFIMKFETLDTHVKINSVNIEHMRYGSKYFKCKSFYQDKIVRQRDRVGSVINTFPARYYRQDRYPDGSSFYGKGYEYADDGSKKIVNFRQDYAFPEISTVLSPVLKSYGGYSYDVMEDENMHPVYLFIILHAHNYMNWLKIIDSCSLFSDEVHVQIKTYVLYPKNDCALNMCNKIIADSKNRQTLLDKLITTPFYTS